MELKTPNVLETKTHHSISLFDLPPEIWTKICKLAVEYKGPILINSMPCLDEAAHQLGYGFGSSHRIESKRCTTHTKCSAERDRLQQPGITRTCHAIRQECLAHYYENNLFYCGSMSGDCWSLQRWLEFIAIEHRGLLRRLYLHPKGCQIGRMLRRLSEKDTRDEDIEELRKFGFGAELGNEEGFGKPLRVIYCEDEDVAQARGDLRG